MVEAVVDLPGLLDGLVAAVEKHVVGSGSISVGKELCHEDAGGLGHGLHREGRTKVGVLGEGKGSGHDEVHGVVAVGGAGGGR